jgi:hypothetical protein
MLIDAVIRTYLENEKGSSPTDAFPLWMARKGRVGGK